MPTVKQAAKTQKKSSGTDLYVFKPGSPPGNDKKKMPGVAHVRLQVKPISPQTQSKNGTPTKPAGTFAYHVVDAKAFREYLAIERSGVPAKSFLQTIDKLKLPNSRVFQIFNIPKSTAAHKISVGGKFVGVEALASIRLAKLLSLAEKIVSNSLHPDAKNFDSGKWLGEWIERSQPALGGMKPSDLLDTEVGGQRVIQVLGALESGSYQ